MNIKRAKAEIQQSIQAYLKKDEFGEYRIPVSSQRPLFLIGPPGIGKTAIMEQIAGELKIGLVAYTITHHTRQSAVGLPMIEKKEYGGVEYSVTEYTMSEIIAAVYQKMEDTGLTEGILFIDEINCVSETLAATMLQFLQQKTFGNHKVPKGWVIVAAGNPPEYNKSVREYDLVTLDRIRKLNVTEDYKVWKEYAYKNSVHGAIITYLDLKPDHFYRIETDVDGVHFVTARGWEDLSKLLFLYEELGMEADTAFVGQYLQHPKVAKDFANYLEFYHRYKKMYDMDQLLSGKMSKEMAEQFEKAPFDEKLTMIGLVLDQLYLSFKEVYYMDLYTRELFGCLKQLKVLFTDPNLSVSQALEQLTESVESLVTQQKLSWKMEKEMERVWAKVVRSFSDYETELKKQQMTDKEVAFEWIRSAFEAEKAKRKEAIAGASDQLDHAFEWMEQCFGVSQELVIFLTELTMNQYSASFVASYGCEKYDRYSQELLYRQKQERIQKEIKEALYELNQ